MGCRGLWSWETSWARPCPPPARLRLPISDGRNLHPRGAVGEEGGAGTGLLEAGHAASREAGNLCVPDGPVERLDNSVDFAISAAGTWL